MKNLIRFVAITITILSNSVFSYDAVIKDNRGRVTGYMDTQGDKTYFVDKYGRRGDYIEKDGAIKDKYGRRKGKVEKK